MSKYSMIVIRSNSAPMGLWPILVDRLYLPWGTVELTEIWPLCVTFRFVLLILMVYNCMFL
jgi:hypothetical protein